MLQKERAFQQQGRFFIDKVWMAFDEARRGLDVEDDLLKQFTGGESMALRRS